MQRHELDLTSLIAGLLFVGMAILFLSDLVGTIDLHVRWVWPALLMGLGVALLASGPTRRNGNGHGHGAERGTETGHGRDAEALDPEPE